MADTPRLTVLTGSLSGQELEVDLSGGEAVVGSDPTCTVHVEDPGLSPRHALLQVSGDEILIQSADYASEVLVNGNAIAWLTPLSEGDEITLGGVKLRFGPASGGAPAAAANPFASAGDDVAPSFDFGGDSDPEPPPDLGLAEPEPDPTPEPEAAPEPPPLKLKEPPALKLKALPDRPPRDESGASHDGSPPPLPPPPLPSQPRPVPGRRAPRPARPAARGGGSLAGRSPRAARRIPVARYALVGLGAVAVLGAAGWFALPLFMPPRLDGVSPQRVSTGQTVVLQGAWFGRGAGDNEVLFGAAPGRVVEASASQLVAEVPALEMGGSQELPVPVRVRVGGRESQGVQISVFQAPRLSELRPEVAMPGDEIELHGVGWSDAAEVLFDVLPAELLAVEPARIRARVPALTAAEARVTVRVGALSSAPLAFTVGRLPLVTGVEPASAAPGSAVRVLGKGFGSEPDRVLAQVAGVPALVTAAKGDELTLVVPRGAAAGEGPLEVRVPGSTHTGSVALRVNALSGPLAFHFVAQPFTLAGSADRDRASVVSDSGTGFVVAGVEGSSAALRAQAFAERLNAAAPRLASGATIEVRDAAGAPVIAVSGGEPLLEVSEADAAAYNEAWARPARGGSGPPVTRERLARWWGAVLADLARVLARGEAPTEAASLAREGAALADLHRVAQGRPPRDALAGRAVLRESLRSLALRVPASVTGSAAAASAAAAADPARAASGAAGAPPAAGFELNGIWVGSERQAGRRRQISVTFEGNAGQLTYIGGVALTLPLVGVTREGAQVGFAIARGEGALHYAGTWDGKKLSGAISSRAGGAGDVGTFELLHR